MIYRTSPEDIADYYQRQGINRSALKTINSRGMEAFLAEEAELLHGNEKVFEEKEHFILGHGVDCLITEGKDIFEQKFHHSNLAKKPSATPMAIVKMVLEKAIAKELERLDEGEELEINESFKYYDLEIFNAMNEVTIMEAGKPKVGYYMNRAKRYEEDTRIEGLLKDGTCQLYWEDLLKARGKQVLSEEQYDCINNMYMSLTTHPYTAYLFDEESYTEEGNMDLVYQMPLYWDEEVGLEGETIECKCLPDMFIVDHNLQIITPIDLKTLGDYITRFHKHVKARDYHMQGSFYSRGIHKSRDQISSLLRKDVRSYEMSNFAFVVISTRCTGVPLVFPLRSELLNKGEWGEIDGSRYGWRQGLDKYYRWQKKGFSLSSMLEVGIVWIDENFELVNTIL